METQTTAKFWESQQKELSHKKRQPHFLFSKFFNIIFVMLCDSIILQFGPVAHTVFDAWFRCRTSILSLTIDCIGKRPLYSNGLVNVPMIKNI